MSKFYEQFWKEHSVNHLQDFDYKWPVLEKYMPRKSTDNILDYGCGSGKILKELIKMNPKANFIGMDVSKKAIQLAKMKLPKVNFYVVEDGGKLPVKSNSIDFIFAGDVIEHAFYTQELINEFSRILKPGGKLVISTPYHGVIKNIVISLVGFEKVFDPVDAHIRFFTIKSLSGLLNNGGFKVNRKAYYGRFYPLSSGFLFECTKE